MVNRSNGALTCAIGHAEPSLVNGSGGAARRQRHAGVDQRRGAEPRRQVDPERRVRHEHSVDEVTDESDLATAPRLDPRHVRDVAEERDVRAGGIAVGGRHRAPPLNSSKWSPPTSRATKIACLPEPVSSAQATHGTVGLPGVSVPAATRGSSASCSGLAFSEHLSSALVDAAHGTESGRRARRVEHVGEPGVPLPTDCQWKPPSAPESATILAANTWSLPRSPRWLSPTSYQTTQPTLSVGPVNAMSGSIPSRLGSMFSVGSPVAEDPPFGVEPVQADLLPAERADARRRRWLEAGARAASERAA